MSVHVDPARLQDASGADRLAMLDHLRGCAACRDAVVMHDPSLLFALLAEAPIPASLLDEVSHAVARNAGRDRAPLGPLDPAAPWFRRGAAAAVVALALGSGYLTMRERPAAPVVAVEEPAAPVALPGTAPAATSLARRADVDVQSGRAVSQVVDFTVGETQVVMVYNRDLQL